MENFLLSLLGSLGAAAIVLIIDRERLPKLMIMTNNSGNVTPSYGPERGKWKFVRAKVVNMRMPKFLQWLPRQTAENCRSTVSLFNEANELLFSMRGRWSDTPELPYFSPGEQAVKVLYPDPATIMASSEQTVDVIAMKEGEHEAYGWNNEAYFNNWRTPHYKLPPGKYRVKIDIFTQNGVSFTKTSALEVGSNIETTFFR